MLEPYRIKKALVFARMGIGNLIMFIPTLKAFRNYFTGTKFYMVVNQRHLTSFKQLLSGYNLIDEFISFDGKYTSINENLRFICKIRGANFDMLIKNFLGGINLMIPTLGIPNRVGHISSPDFPIRCGFVFNYPVVMGKGEHEINRNLRLFYAVAGNAKVTHELSFQLNIPEPIFEKAKYIIGSNTPPLIGMQIGTSAVGGWKEWAAQRFGALADKLIFNYRARIILFGDNTAEGKGKVVESCIPSNKNLINLIGKTSIMEAAALIKMCTLLISNDAGLMWVAQAVGTPVIAIYGPTDYRRTGPIGLRDKIIRNELPCSPCYKSPLDYKIPLKCKTKECLTSITPELVLQKVEEFLC